MIKILLFAGMKEKMKRDFLLCQKSPLTVSQLKEWLKEEYPALSPDLERAMVAVNETFAGEDTVIDQGDLVALIPPVSGG